MSIQLAASLGHKKGKLIRTDRVFFVPLWLCWAGDDVIPAGDVASELPTCVKARPLIQGDPVAPVAQDLISFESGLGRVHKVDAIPLIFGDVASFNGGLGRASKRDAIIPILGDGALPDDSLGKVRKVNASNLILGNSTLTNSNSS